MKNAPAKGAEMKLETLLEKVGIKPHQTVSPVSHESTSKYNADELNSLSISIDEVRLAEAIRKDLGGAVYVVGYPERLAKAIANTDILTVRRGGA